MIFLFRVVKGVNKGVEEAHVTTGLRQPTKITISLHQALATRQHNEPGLTVYGAQASRM